MRSRFQIQSPSIAKSAFALHQRLQNLMLTIPDSEVLCSTRGFTVNERMAQATIEQVGRDFLSGYHAAIGDQSSDRIRDAVEGSDFEQRGFVIEGAAFGCALLDSLSLSSPRSRRIRALFDAFGDRHTYLIHVGVGWVLGRLPIGVEGFLGALDPLLKWLALDGYGFHAGYFGWRRSVSGQMRPSRLSGYQLRAFDQGLGRSLWFVYGADPTRIAQAIACFSPERHTDLWSGVGLACAYAGGASEDAIRAMRMYSGCHVASLAQGVAFASQARALAGNPATHTEAACQIICGADQPATAAIVRRIHNTLPRPFTDASYGFWRASVTEHFRSNQS